MTVSWGIDMSTALPSVGVASLTWHTAAPATLSVHTVTKNDGVAEYLSQTLADPTAVVAVDVPFGWPSGFAKFLALHAQGPTPLPEPNGRSAWSALAGRETDRQVREAVKIQGLSVSFDKLGATAAMWSEIEFGLLATMGHRLDRSGITGPIVETWPRAAWSRFVGRSENPAKLTPTKFEEALEHVVDFKSPSWRAYPEARREHAQDAIVCALVARARQLDQTDLPKTMDTTTLARSEGWIHIAKLGISLSALIPE